MASSMPAAPAYTLIVIHPFGAYNKGDAITDPETVAAILAGKNAHHVNKVAQ
jgi:hypothetical protein